MVRVKCRARSRLRVGMALESWLGSRIVLGCSTAWAGRGATWAREKFVGCLRCHHMYGRQLLTLGNKWARVAGKGGGGSHTRKEETAPRGLPVYCDLLTPICELERGKCWRPPFCSTCPLIYSQMHGSNDKVSPLTVCVRMNDLLLQTSQNVPNLERAFTRPLCTLVRASHTLWDFDGTCHMNSVAILCGPASPVCTRMHRL